MSLAKHLKQNTATIFDLTVIETGKESLSELPSNTQLNPPTELLTALQEYDFKYHKALDLKVMDVYVIEAVCNCFQALVKMNHDVIQSFDKVVEETKYLDCDFNFEIEDVTIFGIKDNVYFKVDEVVYASTDETVNVNVIRFFTRAKSQAFVKMIQDLDNSTSNEEPMMGTGILEMLTDGSIQDSIFADEEMIEESNKGNLPIHIHRRLVRLAFNEGIDGILISPEGEHYIRETEENGVIVFIPMIDKHFVGDVVLVDDQEELTDLFLGEHEIDEPVLAHLRYKEHPVIQEIYPDYAIAGIFFSAEQLDEMESKGLYLNDIVDSMTKDY